MNVLPFFVEKPLDSKHEKYGILIVMETKYSFTKGLTKTVINGVIFLAPMLIGLLPSEVANMTLSALLYVVYNWLKVSYSK